MSHEPPLPAWLFVGAAVQIAKPPPDCDVGGVWIVEAVGDRIFGGVYAPPWWGSAGPIRVRQGAQALWVCLEQLEPAGAAIWRLSDERLEAIIATAIKGDGSDEELSMARELLERRALDEVKRALRSPTAIRDAIQRLEHEAPDDCHIVAAERAAARSPCAKSQRGVVLFDPVTGEHHGEGWNGPPRGSSCPGMSACGSNCNKLCVHAEIRALRGQVLRMADGRPLGVLAPPPSPSGLQLLHVKLGADGHVTPGGPPSCWQCSREVLDVGFVAGVWLFQLPTVAEANAAGVFHMDDPRHARLARWRYYAAEDFHAVTLTNTLTSGDDVEAGR